MKTLIVLIALIPMTVLGQQNLPLKDTSLFIHFDKGKSELNSKSQKQLFSLAGFINSKNTRKVVVAGHTDSDGEDTYNIDLSKKRTYTVYSYLAGKNVNTKIMSVSSFGEKKPIAKNTSEKGKEQNRRVQVVVSFLPKQQIAAVKKDSTVLSGAKGARIIIQGDSLGGYKVSELNFKISEAYNPCDMLAQGLNTMNTGGSCLQSGGMVFMNVTYKTKQVRSNGREKLEIWIPTENPDDKMEVYIPSKKKGITQWQTEKKKPQVKKEDGKYFYVFQTSLKDGWNIDKLMGPCPATGPLVKTKGSKQQNVYVNSGTSITGSNYVKGKIYQTFDMQGQDTLKVTAIASTKDNQTFVAHKKLSELKYRPRKKMYCLRKRDYKKVISSFPSIKL